MSITSELKNKLFQEVENLETDMTKSLCHILRFPAVSPHKGGHGEEAKAQEISKLISKIGLSEGAKIEWIRIPDEKSKTGNRPSVILRTPGRTSQRLWLLCHLDVVFVGDRTAWKTDPFTPVASDGRVFARGANDNGQSIIAMIYALKALKNLGITPEFEICLGFVAGGVMENQYSIEPMVNKKLVDFQKEDMILVPDGGDRTGTLVKIAEKGLLQVEFTIRGKQTHASSPEFGINACRAANVFSFELDEALHKKFPDRDDLFPVETSTFEPTRRLINVVSINVIPGVEKLSFDCRVLPHLKLDDVMKTAEDVMEDVMSRFGVSIELKVIERFEPAPNTSPESPVAKLLVKVVSEALGVKPRFGGGGVITFAAIFRHAGIPAISWEQNTAGLAQQANEYADIKFMINNAKVFALMMAGG